MSIASFAARNLAALFAIAGCLMATATTQVDDLYLADAKAFPGQLWLSQSGGPERSIFRRQPEANPAYPRAAMKLGQIAVGPDNAIYYVSGLDGYLMHLKDGRHEILSFEFNGQIRDVACTGEEHTVYFSVVPTPQNDEPLADGKIYRRDLWNGRPTEVATVRQSEVGGNWWGCFAIRNGIIYLTTFEERSRLLKLTSAGAEPVFPENSFKIQGISSGPDGNFYFATGSDKIYRTTNFQNVEVAWQGERPFSDVTLPAVTGSPGP